MTEQYKYYRLDKSNNGPKGFFRVCAVSRKPILREQANIFGRGVYKILLVSLRPEDDGSHPFVYSDPGAFIEQHLITFSVEDEDVPVDLEMLNMNIVNKMFEKIRDKALDATSQKRSIEK